MVPRPFPPPPHEGSGSETRLGTPNSQTCQVSGSLDDACLLSLLIVLVSWSRARQVMPRPAEIPNHCQPNRRPWLSPPRVAAARWLLSPLVQGRNTILRQSIKRSGWICASCASPHYLQLTDSSAVSAILLSLQCHAASSSATTVILLSTIKPRSL